MLFEWYVYMSLKSGHSLWESAMFSGMMFVSVPVFSSAKSGFGQADHLRSIVQFQ